MIMEDDQGGSSQDKPPVIQVRGLVYGTAEQYTQAGLSKVIIPYKTYQIIPRINDGMILRIIRKQNVARQRCYTMS